MEVITGYFISKEQAESVVEHLRNHGFKGEISIVGHENGEDIHETDHDTINPDNIEGKSNFGVTGAYAGAFGTNASMLGGGGAVFATGPVLGINGGLFGEGLNGILDHWGVPKSLEEEIKNVVEAGNIVVLISCEENEKQVVRKTLLDNGAQNIHI